MTSILPKTLAMGQAASRFSALFVLAAIMAALVLQPIAQAAETEWVRNEGGAVRIVATPAAPDGTIRAAVEVRLEPGWTTYWMNPGQAGIPPRLGTDGSTNLKSAELRFPAPVSLDEGGVWAIGYDRSVAFPLLLTQEKIGEPTIFEAQLFLGVCKDICIPVQASYSIETDAGAAQAGPAAIVVAGAFAALPEPPSADFAIGPVVLSKDGKTIQIEVRLPASDSEGQASSLYVSGPPGWSFGQAKPADRGQTSAHFSVAVTDAPEGGTLRGQTLLAVVTDGARSMQDTAVVR